MNKPLFITIEGPDGAGKSTQISLMRDFIESAGFEVVVTREPGGTDIGEQIRHIILDKANDAMDYKTEALLYAASRAQHISELIRPALDAGKVVICDRFIDSSVAYQGYGRDLGDFIEVINRPIIGECMPDITFLMKLDPAVGKRRIVPGEEDRLEMEDMSFHDKVFYGYESIEKNNPNRVVGIDAARSIDEISADIKGHLERFIR